MSTDPLRELLRKIIIDNGGFLRDCDIAELANLDRLRQLLIRCNGGRMLVAAQSVAHYCLIIDDSRIDWVRDVSLPTSDRAYSGDYSYVSKLNGREAATPSHVATYSDESKRRELEFCRQFNESDCSGVYDGFGVTSDANPGL